MTTLQRRALARLPLTADEVENLYAEYAVTGEQARRLRIFHVIRELCESHKRLRAELQGAEALLAEHESKKGGA